MAKETFYSYCVVKDWEYFEYSKRCYTYKQALDWYKDYGKNLEQMFDRRLVLIQLTREEQ